VGVATTTSGLTVTRSTAEETFTAGLSLSVTLTQKYSLEVRAGVVYVADVAPGMGTFPPGQLEYVPFHHW
jgi:hypothetical protein